jgi:hypothetical protein
MEKRFRAPFSPRTSKNKPPRKRIASVCEGERTETDYFRYLLREWKSRFKKVESYVSIEIVGPKAAGGSVPGNLIPHAVRILKETERTKAMWDKASQIWCVFDVEAEGRRGNLLHSVAGAKRQGVRLAISNPCFELWFYLHFHYCETAVADAREMQTLLKRCWPEYTKSGGEFSALAGLRDTAMRNAERLRKNQHTRPSSDPVPRPHTDVDELITAVEAMLADIR